MKILLLLALACAPMFCQNRYSVTSGDVVLSGTATTLTIQRPASGSTQITLESATVFCSVACTFTQAFNGVAATATAGTAVAIPGNTAPATATVWTASNVGTGTAVGGIVRVAAAQDRTILFTAPVCNNMPCPGVILNGAGTAANYSITVAAITGTANITLIWKEN